MTDRHPPWDSSTPTTDADASGKVVRWREISAGVISGLVVALFTVGVQAWLDDSRESAADRRENLRFVREQVAAGTIGEVPLRAIDLHGQNLSELSLEGAQMTGANLSEANLTKANLPGVQLRGADLSGATLVGAELGQTQLQGANLTGADLSGAHFVGWGQGSNELVNADLSSTILVDTKLTGVELPRAILQADFSGADFDQVDLQEVTFYGVRLYGADLRGAFLPEVLGEHVCYNHLTRWPEGYLPPQNHPYSSCVGPREGP